MNQNLLIYPVVWPVFSKPVVRLKLKVFKIHLRGEWMLTAVLVAVAVSAYLTSKNLQPQAIPVRTGKK